MMTTRNTPRSSQDVLQEKIEELEAGAPIEACLADLAPEDRELLQLVAALRSVSFPERDAEVVAAQRAGFVRQLDRQPDGALRGWRGLGETVRSLRNRLQPRGVLVGTVAVAVCAIIALVVASVVLPGSDGGRDLPDDASAQVASSQEGGVVEGQPGAPVSETAVASTRGPDAAADLSSTEPGSTELAAESSNTVFVPVVAASSPPDPTRATLEQPKGLVEIQVGEGGWIRAPAGRVVRAGEGLRTGSLSSAVLSFYDGSQARLGPNTVIRLEELDARLEGGPRVVVMTQQVGQTDHEVASIGGVYEVRTPAAQGVATGTAFRVRVTEEQTAHFSVEEGAVAVTGQDVTVEVVAGQTTVIQDGEPPEEPAFRITGEGQVTQIGPTWVIAGQRFEVQAETVIIGDPQVGDWVSVEGHLSEEGTPIADLIELLESPPVNAFTITGPVDAMGENEWTVAGQTIVVNPETLVDEGIEVGDRVRVEGVIQEGGGLLAEAITRIEDEAPGLPFEFTGVVQAMGDDAWMISGIEIAVGDETEIDPAIAVGDVVKVEGWITDDDVWMAQEIKQVESAASKFEFTGLVESVDPWIVAGISFETDEMTEIGAGIAVGDLVKVEGLILSDGTWLASEIKLVEEEDDDLLRISFVDVVDSIDPWIVGGLPIATDDATQIEEGIKVGDLVRVTVEIMPDGTWLATEIELFGSDGGVLGCMYIAAVVEAVGDGWIEVSGSERVDLEGVIIQGEIRVGSVVLMQVCVQEDGTIDIVMIVVIHQPEPTPPPVPPDDDDDEGDQGGKVTVCHKPDGKNPHMITIDRAALGAHLGHGDHEGPCE